MSGSQVKKFAWTAWQIIKTYCHMVIRPYQHKYSPVKYRIKFFSFSSPFSSKFILHLPASLSASHYTKLQFTAMKCIALQYNALHCSALPLPPIRLQLSKCTNQINPCLLESLPRIMGGFINMLKRFWTLKFFKKNFGILFRSDCIFRSEDCHKLTDWNWNWNC